MREIIEVLNDEEQIIDNASVSAGGSTTSTVIGSSDQKNKLAVGYDLAGSGSPNVELQEYHTDDSAGNKVWVTVASSTSAADVLSTDNPAKEYRVKVSETGGTYGLTDIMVNADTRPL